MDLVTTSREDLQREIEDIQRKRQELQMLEERLVLQSQHVEKLSLSMPAPSLSPTNLHASSYQLVSGDARLKQQSTASARRATVAMTPRSHSNIGMTSNPARLDTNMIRSQSTMSAQSHPMSRNVSQTSNLSKDPTAAIRPSLMPGMGMMDRLHQDEPPNAYMLGDHSRHSSTRLPEVNEDPLADFGQSPIDFLNSADMDGDAYYSPNDVMMSYCNPLHTGGYYPYPNCALTAASSTPSLGSAESVVAPETTPLTRDNSSIGDSFVGSFELARLESGQPLPVSRAVSNDVYRREMSMTFADKQASLAGGATYLLGVGANLAPPPAHAYASAEAAHQATDMSRSSSNSSTRSTASNQERRAKEARERQIQNGLKTIIRPKPSSTEESPSSSDRNPVSSTSAAASASVKKDAKMALNKTHYQRPKHPKVHCTQCNDQPDGFRGEHELRRHISSKHSVDVVKWVCQDPATLGIKTTVQIVTPLDKCKACTGNKQYGAYYNAAAHLRRAHFKQRPKRGKGTKKAAASAAVAAAAAPAQQGPDKRGGKGGGDWPAMSELKPWMKKVTVRNGVVYEEGAGDALDEVMDDDIETMNFDDDDAVVDDYSAASYPSIVGVVGKAASSEEKPLLSATSASFGLSPYSSSSSTMSPLQQDMSFQESMDSPYPGFLPHEAHTVSPSATFLDYDFGMPLEMP